MFTWSVFSFFRQWTAKRKELPPRRCKILKKTKKRKKRCARAKPWLQRREQFGAHDTLLRELRSEDESEYKIFLRMSPAAFDELLDMVEGDITKENTVMRAAVPAKIKLAATLRFLATGSTYADLQYTFRIHKSTPLCNNTWSLWRYLRTPKRRIFEGKFISYKYFNIPY